MPIQTRRKGGRFLLSDSKITEIKNAGYTPENYTTSKLYHTELVNFVIDNSTISSVGSGSFGITYKLILKNGVKSPYFKIDYGKIGTGDCTADNFYKEPCIVEIRTFLLKLSFIGRNREEVSNVDKTEIMYKVPMEDFQKEAKIQDEIYEKTFDLANSLVPACVSPPLISNTSTLLYERLKKTGSILSKLELKRASTIGLFLMEFAEGYTTLDSILDNANLLTREGAIIGGKDFTPDASNAFLLYQAAHLLLYKAGYAHGDHHYGNVMINLKKNKVLLIDFGQTTNISSINSKIDFIPYNFTEILNYLQTSAELNKFTNLTRLQKLNYFPVHPLINEIIENRAKESRIILERINNKKAPNFEQNLTFSNYNKLRWDLLGSNYTSRPGTPTVEEALTSDTSKTDIFRDDLFTAINNSNTSEVMNILASLKSSQSSNNSLIAKDAQGLTLLHHAAIFSNGTDSVEDISLIKRNFKSYKPKTPQLQIVKALIEAEPKLPDIKDNKGIKPGNEFYSGEGATRSYIKRRQADRGAWTAFRLGTGLTGGATRRHKRSRRASYRGHRAARS